MFSILEFPRVHEGFAPINAVLRTDRLGFRAIVLREGAAMAGIEAVVSA